MAGQSAHLSVAEVKAKINAVECYHTGGSKSGAETNTHLGRKGTMQKKSK